MSDATVSITCPLCETEVDSRGLHGHVRFAHDLDSDTATRLLSNTLQLVNRNKGCVAGCGRTAEYAAHVDAGASVLVCRQHLRDVFKMTGNDAFEPDAHPSSA